MAAALRRVTGEDVELAAPSVVDDEDAKGHAAMTALRWRGPRRVQASWAACKVVLW
jgi:hypothetical protein